MKTFAIIAYILLGNQTHEYAVDNGMTEESCQIEAGELEWIELDAGLEIAVDAIEVQGLLCEVE